MSSRVLTSGRLERVFALVPVAGDRKSTRLNSSHLVISYAVFCLKKKTFSIYSFALYPHFSGAAAACTEPGAVFSYSINAFLRHAVRCVTIATTFPRAPG